MAMQKTLCKNALKAPKHSSLFNMTTFWQSITKTSQIPVLSVKYAHKTLNTTKPTIQLAATGSTTPATQVQKLDHWNLLTCNSKASSPPQTHGLHAMTFLTSTWAHCLTDPSTFASNSATCHKNSLMSTTSCRLHTMDGYTSNSSKQSKA